MNFRTDKMSRKLEVISKMIKMAYAAYLNMNKNRKNSRKNKNVNITTS